YCNNCGSNRHHLNQCYEARLSIGLGPDDITLIGQIDGMYFKPVDLRPAVLSAESNTVLKYNSDKRSLVYENERFKKGKGAADFISTRELLAGSRLSELGGIEPLVDKGLASAAIIDNELQLKFEVPTPVEFGELVSGFVTYVDNPNNNTSH